MLLRLNSGAVNHMRRSFITAVLQLEVEPVPSADPTLELAPARVRAQENGVRVSLPYPLGGGDAAVRCPGGVRS